MIVNIEGNRVRIGSEDSPAVWEVIVQLNEDGTATVLKGTNYKVPVVIGTLDRVPTLDRIRERCPLCMREVPINSSGEFMDHYVKNPRGLGAYPPKCNNSGKSVDNGAGPSKTSPVP